MPDGYAEWGTILAAVGQTAFICLWAALPWWREVIGVAMFAKSLTLMLLLDTAVLFIYLPQLATQKVGYVLETMLWVAIWGQVAALVYERRRRPGHHTTHTTIRQGVPPPDVTRDGPGPP